MNTVNKQIKSSIASNISGIGYGSDHIWERLGTHPRWGGSPSERYTEFQCRNCRAFFRHFYHTTNIFEAIKSRGIPDKCLKGNQNE